MSGSAYYDFRTPGKIPSGLETTQPRIGATMTASLQSSQALGRSWKFPSSRKFLWDRTPLGRPESVEPQGQLPVFIVPSALHKGLGPRASIAAFFTCPDGRHMQATLQSGSSSPDSSAPNSIVVPVAEASRRSHQDVSSLIQSFQHALDKRGCAHLAGGLSMSCSLGAAGPASTDESAALSITLLAPEASLMLSPLYSKRMCDVPLSQTLAQQQLGTSVRTGYLTMDQARSLLPLDADDPQVYSTPLVGVWLHGAKSVAHPVVYSAALRFAFSTTLPDRAMQPDGAFLLLLFTGESPVARCYEACFTSSQQYGLPGGGGNAGLRLVPYKVTATLAGQTSAPLELRPVRDDAAAGQQQLILPAAGAGPGQGPAQQAVVPQKPQLGFGCVDGACVPASQPSRAGSPRAAGGAYEAAHGYYGNELRGSGSKLMTSPSKAMKILSHSGYGGGGVAGVPGITEPFPGGGWMPGAAAPGAGAAPPVGSRSSVGNAVGAPVYGMVHGVPIRESPPIPRTSGVPTPFRPGMTGRASTEDGAPRDPRLARYHADSLHDSTASLVMQSVATARTAEAPSRAAGPSAVSGCASLSVSAEWTAVGGVMSTPAAGLGRRPSSPSGTVQRQQELSEPSSNMAPHSTPHAGPTASERSFMQRAAQQGQAANHNYHSGHGLAATEPNRGATWAPQPTMPPPAQPGTAALARPPSSCSSAAPSSLSGSQHAFARSHMHGSYASMADSLRSGRSGAGAGPVSISQSLDDWLKASAATARPPQPQPVASQGHVTGAEHHGTQPDLDQHSTFSARGGPGVRPGSEAVGTSSDISSSRPAVSDAQLRALLPGESFHGWLTPAGPSQGASAPGQGGHRPHESQDSPAPQHHTASLHQHRPRQQPAGEEQSMHGQGTRRHADSMQHHTAAAANASLGANMTAAHRTDGNHGGEDEEVLPSDPVLLRQEVVQLRRQMRGLQAELQRLSGLLHTAQAPHAGQSHQPRQPGAHEASQAQESCAEHAQQPPAQAGAQPADTTAPMPSRQRHADEAPPGSDRAFELLRRPGQAWGPDASRAERCQEISRPPQHAQSGFATAAPQQSVPASCKQQNHPEYQQQYEQQQQQQQQEQQQQQQQQKQQQQKQQQQQQAQSHAAQAHPSQDAWQRQDRVPDPTSTGVLAWHHATSTRHGHQHTGQGAAQAAAAAPSGTAYAARPASAVPLPPAASSSNAQQHDAASAGAIADDRGDTMSISGRSDRGSVWSMASLQSSLHSSSSQGPRPIPQAGYGVSGASTAGRQHDFMARAGPLAQVPEAEGLGGAEGAVSQEASGVLNRYVVGAAVAATPGGAHSVVGGASHELGQVAASHGGVTPARSLSSYRHVGNATRLRSGGRMSRRRGGSSSDDDSDAARSVDSDSEADVAHQTPRRAQALPSLPRDYPFQPNPATSAAAPTAAGLRHSVSYGCATAAAAGVPMGRSGGSFSSTGALERATSSSALMLTDVVRTKYTPIDEDDSGSSDTEMEAMLMKKYGIRGL